MVRPRCRGTGSPMLQRSLVRSSAILLALGVLAAAACARLDPTRDPQSPTPVPKAAFSDVTLEETGGIDGRHNVLLVRTDGVAISMSWKPSAGQLGPDTVTRLRTLLESERFRLEVARGGESASPQCSDQITMRLVMGALAISQTGPCPTGAAPTPAFDEILSILSAPLRGEFDRPVTGGEPRLVPIRLEAGRGWPAGPRDHGRRPWPRGEVHAGRGTGSSDSRDQSAGHTAAPSQPPSVDASGRLRQAGAIPGSRWRQDHRHRVRLFLQPARTAGRGEPAGVVTARKPKPASLPARRSSRRARRSGTASLEGYDA
jgi:hypothetical protein